MDRERFQSLCREALAGEHRREGIGTLGEKTLHAVLKAYFAGPGDGLEVPVGPFVADVQGPEGVVEIQTGNFRRLREKLPLFLSLGPVTVVYPVPTKKWLVWLEEDGTLTPRRKSPKAAGPWQVLPELYDIRDLLLAPGLTAEDVSVTLELPDRYLMGSELEAFAVYTVNGGAAQETASVRVPLHLDGLAALFDSSRGGILPAAEDVSPAVVRWELAAAAVAALALAAAAFRLTRRRAAPRKT